MPKLHIDIETYSDIDISNGVYRYVDTPFFEIQLFAYAIDDKPVKKLDLMNGDTIPTKIVKMILDKTVEKWAHNAQFERVCLSKFLGLPIGEYLDPTKWRDTAVYGAALGLPRSLENMALALDVEQKKDRAGKALIRYFAIPCKPTKANGERTKNLPEHDPEKWRKYGRYVKQDVRTERAIHAKLSALYTFPEHEWRYYEMDQRINDHGIMVDSELVARAIALKNVLKDQASDKLRELTGVESVTKIKQLKEWAAARGVALASLDANAKEDLLNNAELENEHPDVFKMVRLLDDAGGSAVAKFDKIQAMKNSDGRIRGQLIFMGAGATGRFAGKGVQVQNLPRIYLKDAPLKRNRRRVKHGRVIPINELTQLCRTALVPTQGKEFAVSDYSQIEARVLPWYAGEDWALDAFRANQDIYVATAVKMYHVDYDTAKKDYRQKGKQATLALGYGGAVGALEAMGALRAGIPREELPELVSTWRKANRNIVKFWADCEKAAKFVIMQRGKKKVTINNKLTFTYNHNEKLLQIWLPSGRALSYYDAHIDSKKRVRYLGGVKADGSRWHKDTFGGKIVENIVQATARDILCNAMLRIEKNKIPIAFHVHDEVIAEVPKNFDIETLNDLMARPLPAWCEDLPLDSEGATIQFYRKV